METLKIEMAILQNYRDVRKIVNEWVKTSDKHTNEYLIDHLKISRGTFYSRMRQCSWIDKELEILIKLLG